MERLRTVRAGRSGSGCHGARQHLEQAARGAENLHAANFDVLPRAGHGRRNFRYAADGFSGRHMGRLLEWAWSRFISLARVLQVARRRSRPPKRATASCCTKCVRISADACASDRCTRGTGLQQFAQERTGELGALAVEAGDAATGLAADCGPRRPARVPGGHALTVDRDVFSAEVTRAIEAHPRIEIRREEVTQADPTRNCDRCERSFDQRCAGGRDRPANRSRSAIFLRQHQPDCERRIRSIMSIAFRASRYGKSLDGTDDYSIVRFDKSSMRLSLMR